MTDGGDGCYEVTDGGDGCVEVTDDGDGCDIVTDGGDGCGEVTRRLIQKTLAYSVLPLTRPLYSASIGPVSLVLKIRSTQAD